MLFSPDDFLKISSKYFGDLLHIDASLSDWEPIRPVALSDLALPNFQLQTKNLSSYYIDNGESPFLPYKEKFREMLSFWENRDVDRDGFTVCSTGTTALLAVMSMLSSLGIKENYFETPSYFVAIKQAEFLGMPYTLLPTYRKDNYKLDLPYLKKRSALWISQPKHSLGLNQSVSEVELLSQQAKEKDSFVVVDELIDHSFHSILAQVSEKQVPCIRIKSFLKSIGLHGSKVSFILHPVSLRKQMIKSLEILGNSVDLFSLELQSSFSTTSIPRLLNKTNKQIVELRAKIEDRVEGTQLSVNKITNGYLGTIVVNLRQFGKTRNEQRASLLSHCRKVKTPIMDGSAIYAAVDKPNELIRVNFFTPEVSVLNGICNILKMWKESSCY